jgi:subtilisin family serine protease
MLTPMRRMTGIRGAAGFLACAVVLLVLTVLAAVPARAAPADSVRDAQQWVLDAIHAPPAWTASQGRGVTVAVLDSGVLPSVSDLQGSVITGPDFTHTGTPESNSAWGQHGTWMASLVAGHGHGFGGNDGVLGVAPQSRILSERVITDREDPAYRQYQQQPEQRIQQWLASAIDYAVGHGARVISMSIGYSAPSLPVRQALQYALARGAIVVASSGNSGQTSFSQKHSYAPYAFPADYPGVLTVAATDQDGSSANFSSSNQSVQVAAPGVSVPAQGRDGQYWLVSGTSPACALVSGIAALIKSSYPDLPPAQVDQAITSTASGLSGHKYDDQVGFGEADATAALARAGQLMRATPSSGGTALGAIGGVPPEGSSAPGPSRPAAAQSYFGGGAGHAAAPPVAPRGNGMLLLFGLLGLTSLLVSIVAVTRLGVLRRAGSALAAADPAPGAGPAPGASPGPWASPGPPAGPGPWTDPGRWPGPEPDEEPGPGPAAGPGSWADPGPWPGPGPDEEPNPGSAGGSWNTPP